MAIERTVETDVYCDVCGEWIMGWKSNDTGVSRAWAAEYTRRRGGRHMEYNLRRRNKKAAAFYVSAEWRKVRAFALSLYDSLDMYAYYVQHKIVVADMVHHITEIEEDWTQRLNVENLFPLSNGNHGIISALYKKDEATKRQTQELLRNIIQQHWKGVGGIEKVLTRLD